MVVLQGDIFWADLPAPAGSETGFRRPVVVVQNNLLNRSPIHTVVACAVTSSLRRADAPGNVVLPKGEANLPVRSVVDVTQIVTADKARLTEKIGSLPAKRLAEVLSGVRFVISPLEAIE
jgi:mRNA interferase MazF